MSWNDPFDGEPVEQHLPSGEGVPPGATKESDDSAGDEQAAPVEPSAMERVTAERDEYLDALQRLQAEFDNYRKRTLRQQTELLQRASESLVERLLPVLDTLDLALAHLGGDAPAGDGVKDALEQVDALLKRTLAQEGLERIDERDVPFDPSIHDAVAHEPAPERADAPRDDGAVSGARVSDVMRAGYRLKGRVLRPVMVKVEG